MKISRASPQHRPAENTLRAEYLRNPFNPRNIFPSCNFIHKCVLQGIKARDHSQTSRAGNPQREIPSRKSSHIMADHIPGRDLSLLDRLNALKPSSISLSSPAPSSKPDAIERAKPPSREDALSARLKSLRGRVPESPVPHVTDQVRGDRDSLQPPRGEPGSSTGDKLDSQVPCLAPVQTIDDVDSLLYTDDETLEELLEDLRADESWLHEMTAEEEHKRVTAILTGLSESPSVKTNSDRQNAFQAVSPENGDDSSSDDSEGEIMATEVNSVLAKTIDEIEWEKRDRPPSPSQAVPTPPSQPQNARHTSQEAPAEADPFNLPTVPADLEDPIHMGESSVQNRSDSEFEASIAQRMAALKLSGSRALPSTPKSPVESLGLPQAPTFAPGAQGPGLIEHSGLTDEDQKTWCVVCLEDGTVHCLGCESGDDVYCARCWKEMHVGPRAGYDERGHSCETFVSRPRY